jgi:DNA-binding FadR family transcriptional regulator
MTKTATSTARLREQTPVKRRKLYEEVAQRLEEMMLSGALRPGDILPAERELVETFGVGRTAIREALFALQRMGLVSIRNGERAYVTKPTPEAVVSELSGAVRHLLAQPEGARHMQQARSLHETALARYAARHATTDDTARLAAVLEKNRLAIGDPQAFTRTDVEFHLVLAEIARNPVLVSLQVALSEWLSEQRTTSLKVEGADDAAWRAHEAIYRAVAAHDPDAAERAMEAHLGEVGAYYWHAQGRGVQGNK